MYICFDIYIYIHLRCKLYKYAYICVFFAMFIIFFGELCSFLHPDARFVWPIYLQNWVVLVGFHVGFHIPYKTSIWVMASLPKPHVKQAVGRSHLPSAARMLPPWKPNVNAWRGRSSEGGRPWILGPTPWAVEGFFVCLHPTNFNIC